MCTRFLYNRCPFSDLACNFSHRKENAPLCKMWQKGFCIGATGNNCKLRHYYNDMDGAIMQAAKRQAQIPVNETNQLDDYSSPYRVKVVKEVSKQRKEEVDLETGTRKSWVETTEFEVLDLTGETPVKKAKLPLLTKSPLKESNKTVTASKAKNKKTPVKTAPAPTVEPGTCPVCARKFKGDKGVLAHRRAKNSPCHPDKENQARNQVPAYSEQVRGLSENTTRSRVTANQPASQNGTRNPAQSTAQNQTMNSVQVTPPVNRGFFSGFLGLSVRQPQDEDQDDSVIVIPDTPVPGNRRASLRRSIRMA